MTRLWQRLMSKLFNKKSTETLEAERRLRGVFQDDIRVDRAIRTGESIVRENHLGPLIARLFEKES